MDEKDRGIRVLVEYFKSLREEIHIRIREHSRLVWVKIVSLGLITSFLIERFYAGEASVSGGVASSHFFYLIWIVPLAGGVFDMLIAGNLRAIGNLGHYIRRYFDGKFFRKCVNVEGLAFWEQVAGQPVAKFRCYTITDVVVIWIFTLVSYIITVLLRWQLGFTLVDAGLSIGCGVVISVGVVGLVRSITMKRDFFYVEIGGVPNIRWKSLKKAIILRTGVIESRPALATSGYSMSVVGLPPNKRYKLEGGEFIVCLLRGSLKGTGRMSLKESRLLEEGTTLRSGDEGCLLFVCSDEGDNDTYKDEIHGMEIEWSKYDRDMFRTSPQILVDAYRINLWYLGPNKHGGIHNHSQEPIPFVEFHTQLRGNGWMVKYADERGEKRIEEIEMTRGYTHDLFCTIREGEISYPWHEYVAGEKGSLFVVFEDTTRQAPKGFSFSYWQ
jgi:hypothetical protein